MMHISTALKEALKDIPMTYQVTFEPYFFAHEGGTKFYEVMVFGHADYKVHFIVRRWGKMSEKDGGGHIKIERAKTGRGALGLADRAIQQKQGRGYKLASNAFGLHGVARNFESQEHMEQTVRRHYGNDMHKAVLAEFGISTDGSTLAPVEVPKMSVPIPTQPTIQRSQVWGSW